MRAKLYIPYIDLNPENGFTTNVTFNSEQDYINYMNKEYSKSKLTYDDLNNFDVGSKNYNHQDAKWLQKKEKYNYMDIDISLLDINNEEENIDNLLKYFRTGEMCIEQFFMDNTPKLEDIYDEFKAWMRETEQINNTPKLTDEQKMRLVPKKDFKLAFGENSYAIFHNCSFAERFSVRRYAVIVEKIEFVNNLSL